MVFWKRRKSGKEVGKRIHQDVDKAKWLQKVLSREEFTDFNLAQGTSLLYQFLRQDKEPKRERSPEMKAMMQHFMQQVEQMIEYHGKASISERDQQVEALIRQAEFDDDFRSTPLIYYHFRTLTHDERREWKGIDRQISEEIFRFDFSSFDD